MVVSQPSGLRLPFGRVPIYDAIKDGRAYFVLARNLDKWGTLTHFRLSLDATVWPDFYLPSDADDFLTLGTKFFDRNMHRRYSGLMSDAGQHVYIARAPKGTFDYVMEDQMLTGFVHLAYITKKWATVYGMNPEWTPDPAYDYFMMNYNSRDTTAIKIEQVYDEKTHDGWTSIGENRPAELDDIAKHPRCAEWLTDVLGIYRIGDNTVCYVSDEPLSSTSSKMVIPVQHDQRAKRGIVKSDLPVGTAVIYLDDNHTFRRGDKFYVNKKYHTVVGATNSPGNANIRVSPVLSVPMSQGYELISVVNKDRTDLKAYEEWAFNDTTDTTISVESLVDTRLPEVTYRIVGVVIDPKMSDGTKCTAGFYSEEELFNLTLNGYDFGMLAHVAPVVPVRRNDLPESETIRILL